MDQRGTIAKAVFIGMIGWVTLTAAVIDPPHAPADLQDLRHRARASLHAQHVDRLVGFGDPWQGRLLAFFYPFLLRLVIILPLVVVGVVAAIRGSAAHAVAQ